MRQRRDQKVTNYYQHRNNNSGAHAKSIKRIDPFYTYKDDMESRNEIRNFNNYMKREQYTDPRIHHLKHEVNDIKMFENKGDEHVVQESGYHNSSNHNIPLFEVSRVSQGVTSRGVFKEKNTPW